MDQQYGVPCSTAFGKQIRQSKYPVYRMLDRHHGSHFWSGNAVNYEKLYNNILPYALQAIAGSVNSTDRPFVACDFGAGDGGTSMKLMTEIIRAVRAKYGKEKPIVIVYEDLPWNDFKSLFFLTQGLFEDQRNFLPQDKNVFLLASGTNFYERCLPPNYVDLAVSCSAMHWLSKRPCNLQWDIIGQGDKVSYEELDAYKKQAAVDWETILINRAKELKIGAHIIIAIVGTKEGVHSGSTAIYKVKVIPYLRDLWLSFATAGRITKEEFFNTNFSFYYRSEEEFKAPFLYEDSKILKAGLKLVSIEIKVDHFDYSLKHKDDEFLDDEPLSVAHKARRYVNVFRAWSEAIFMFGLDERRSEKEKTEIIDEFFGRFEEDVTRSPSDFGYDLVVAYVDIVKAKAAF